MMAKSSSTKLDDYRKRVAESATRLDELLYTLNPEKLTWGDIEDIVSFASYSLPCQKSQSSDIPDKETNGKVLLWIDASISRGKFKADSATAKKLYEKWCALDLNALGSLEMAASFVFPKEAQALFSLLGALKKSPDPNERAGHDILMDSFGDREDWRSILPLAHILKKAKKPRGRKNKGVKLVNDDSLIHKMVPLIINDGLAVKPAAMKVLENSANADTPSDSDARRLEKRWAEKLELILAT